MSILSVSRLQRLCLGILAGFLLTVCSTGAAEAQARAFFQWGTPQGVDNRVTLSRVPVANAAGVLNYYDVALTFGVDSAGRLTLTPSGIRITATPSLTVGAFRPGIYEHDSCEYLVGAPGVAGGGRVTGSLGGGDDCFDVFSVSWVSGPISGHPNESALRSAGITFQGYSWGTLGEVDSGWLNDGWEPGDLVGVVQSGNNLVVHNFGDDDREDSSVVFTFCPTCR